MTLHWEATKVARDRLSGLIDGGDWACAHADEGGLASVCHELAHLLEPVLADRSESIASLAGIDMLEASGEWDKLSNLLRSRDVSEPPTAAAPTAVERRGKTLH